MDESRAIAHLPNLDIEILHRRLPDERAEQLLISLRAQPSLEVFAGWLDASAAGCQARNPFFAWQRAALALWTPWLAAAARALPDATHGAPSRGRQR
jgi:hypothetical protein